MEEIGEVPARRHAAEVLRRVVHAEQLHPHDGEDEDDDGEHEAEVAERAKSPADDADEKVERRPRFGQLEDPQLECVSISMAINHFVGYMNTFSNQLNSFGFQISF